MKQIPRFALGTWEPDVGEVGTDTLEECVNVFPRPDHYSPFPGLGSISSGALSTACRGIVYVQKTAGTYDTYVATATKLFRYNADTLTFDDVSRSSGGDYNLPADDYWSFTLFGNILIATQLGDVPQYIDVDVGTNFAALGGSPPTARFCTVMDNRLVLYHTTTDPRQARWSEVGNPEDWSGVGAGEQTFKDHGAVMAFLPHARLVILERGLRQIVSTNDSEAFEFQELAFERGTVSPWSVIEVGNFAAWLSEEGFFFGNASGIQNITEGRLSRWFGDNANRERTYQVFGTHDPYSSRLLWAFPTGDTEYNDRILIWDRSLSSPYGVGRFSLIDLDTYVLARLATAGVSLEGGSDSTDMDEAGLPSLDSRLYMAGAPILVAVGTDLKLSGFTGDNLAATITTKSYMLGDGGRARLRQVMPLISGTESDEITVKVKKRNRQSDDWTTSGAISQQASGFHPCNHDSRFHALKFEIAAAKTWDRFQGFYADSRQTSWR